MEPVRIVSASVVHPDHWITQPEAVACLEALGGDRRRLAALARGTSIYRRAVSLPSDQVTALGSTAERNAIYRHTAPALSVRAARRALGEADPASVSCVVTSSCTGYMLPGWSVDIVDQLRLPPSVSRTPITESGCAGGVVALARAVDHLRIQPDAFALAVATELCSLAFQRACEQGNLAASLLFGDGAGACLLATGTGPGLHVIDSASVLLPDSRHLLGFDLTDQGFYPVLRRELVDRLVPAAVTAATGLLARNGLDIADANAWLLHPGGARILAGIEAHAGLERSQTRWSWESMENCGNMSSAAIFDVIRRYLEDSDAPAGHALVAAFGPGVAIELLLVERSC